MARISLIPQKRELFRSDMPGTPGYRAPSESQDTCAVGRQKRVLQTGVRWPASASSRRSASSSDRKCLEHRDIEPHLRVKIPARSDGKSVCYKLVSDGPHQPHPAEARVL